MNAHSTPEASPQYPHPLPDGGLRCAEWALDTLFGPRKPGAWITVVRDVDIKGQWTGGRYSALGAALKASPNAGHYVSVGIVKPGATRRLNTTTEAGACIFFDDVGEIGVNPNAKMDKAWLDLLGPTPTFVVATSEGNFQYFYAFSEPVPAATQQKLFDALKANPDTHGGFIEGNALIRYGRLPSGKNPKPGRGRFSTQLVEASGRKYSVDEIVRAFSLKLPSVGAASPGMSASQSASGDGSGGTQESAGGPSAASGQDDDGAKAFGHYVYRQTFIGRITQLAIANTEAVKAWFPELFPAAWDYHDGQRVYSKDIGRPYEEDISVLPLTSKTPGIKDFAVHDDKNDARQGKRTAVDLVLEWGPENVRGSFQEGAAALAAALWLADRLGLSEEEIETMRAKAASAGPSTPLPENVEPIDLWPSAGALPPLPVGLLPSRIETFARAAAIVVGADDGGFAMAALAVAAGSLDDAIKLLVMPYAKWVESARIWVALVGDPSTKKTPIINTTYEALKSADKALYRFYAAAKAKWEMLSKPDKAITPAPARNRYLISDTTSEAAQEAFRTIGERGLFGVYDELGGWFGSMERYGQNSGGASERRFWLEAYNGGSYLVDRIGRGAFMIANLSLTILGGIQPDLIRKVASAPSDDGLIQRIIPIVLRPGWTPVADQNAASQMQDFDALVPQLLALCPPNAGHLSFDAGAQKIRDDLAKEHENAARVMEGFNKKLSTALGKQDGVFARLCVAWHCIENASSNLRSPALPGGSPEAGEWSQSPLAEIVTEDTARRVAAFMREFTRPHLFHFYRVTLDLPDEHERLLSIAGYILAHKVEVLANRDVQSAVRSMRKLTSKDVTPVLEQLEAFGWLFKGAPLRSGAPPIWRVNPVVHKLFSQRAKVESERREEIREIIAKTVENRRQNAASQE